MHVDNEALHEASAKLERVVGSLDVKQIQQCSFSGLSSDLVSVQSVFQQITELAESDHGLIDAFKWHIAEGICVYTALQSQCEEITRVDFDTKEAFNAVYRSEAAKRNHECRCPADTDGLGDGYSTQNGKRLRSYSSNGIPLVEEPIWPSAEKLAVAFVKFDTELFFQCAKAWDSASELLAELSSVIHKIASEVQNCGSKDAYTHEAGAGIRRWADSIEELSAQSAEVGKHLKHYAVSYADTRTEVNAIADEADRDYREDVIANRLHDGWTYDNKANAVLQEKYNPQLKEVDSHAIEFPVPMRAFHPDHLMEIPEPTQAPTFVPTTPVSTPPITANPEVVKPTPTQPVVPPPPDTNDIHEVTPPAGMPPAETKPNIVDPVIPGEGKGMGPVGGPTGTTPGGASPHVPPAATNPATTGPAGMQTPQPGGAPISGYPGRWANPNQSSNENRDNRPNSNVVVGAGAIGTGVGAGVGAGVGVGVGAGSAIRSGGATGNTGAVPGLGAKGAGAAGTNPNTPSGSGAETATGVGPSAKAGAGAPGSGNGWGTGRPGMGGMPGAPGAATSEGKGKSKPRRSRRSAENTERILPQPGNLPRGIIRHPDDPFYGTGR